MKIRWYKIQSKSNFSKTIDKLNPMKQFYKTLDFTGGDWFNIGEEVILRIPMDDYTKDKDLSKMVKEKRNFLKSVDNKKAEIIEIAYTEGGVATALTSNRKPTHVNLRVEDGNELYDIPVAWLEKIEE